MALFLSWDLMLLPPDQQSQVYRFPAMIKLEEQSVLSGEQQLESSEWNGRFSKY